MEAAFARHAKSSVYLFHQFFLNLNGAFIICRLRGGGGGGGLWEEGGVLGGGGGGGGGGGVKDFGKNMWFSGGIGRTGSVVTKRI